MPTATVTYMENRKSLFGLRSKDTIVSATTELPRVKMTRRFHIQVQTEPGTQWQPVNSSRTIEEAKAIIQEEREEDAAPVSSMEKDIFGGYTDGMVFSVKDTKENATYIYNPQTRSLELNLQ
jgi:hypothetical protein